MNLKKNHTSAFANRKVKGKVLICWGGMYCDKMYYSLCTKTNKQHVSPEYCCRGSWFLFSILKVASWCRLAHLVYFLASFDKLGLFSCCSSLGLPVGPEHKARALSPSRTGCSAGAGSCGCWRRSSAQLQMGQILLQTAAQAEFTLLFCTTSYLTPLLLTQNFLPPHNGVKEFLKKYS